MKPFKIYTKDTKQIETTYNILQRINVITGALLAFVSLVLAISFFDKSAEMLGLIFLGVLAVDVLACVVIYFCLGVKFGMYYDIRMKRMGADGEAVCKPIDSDELPDL